MTRFAERRNKLRRTIRKSGVDGMLVTNEVNVTYLTGFTGDSTYLLLTADAAIVLSDTRYDEQLERECGEMERMIHGTPVTLDQQVAKAAAKNKVSTLAFESCSVSHRAFLQLGDSLSGVELAPTSDIVLHQREIKDKTEVAEIREAVRLAEKTFAVIMAQMTGDQTELEIAANIEHQIRRFGGRGCSFAPIVGVGPNAALPHYSPGDTPISAAPFVLIDWGAQSAGGYMSDLTRVLVTAKISPKLERIYGVVLRAQEQAIAKIRPGAKMGDIDAAARKVITKAGHAKHFGHGLGHGFGLEIHEQPRLSPTQDRELKAGMVVTVEPGIYLPGWGGVRIEDDILVTRSGHEVLTHVSKDLADCIV